MGLYNRIWFSATSGGLGDFVVNAAIAGYRTPAGAAIPNATLVVYVAESADKSQWEIGEGVYTVAGTTVARTTIKDSSTGAKVNFTAAPTVFFDVIASAGDLYPAPTGVALTKTDDTNVTLTLGGTPSQALLKATSITVNWSGTLSVARGGTGAGDAATALANLGAVNKAGDTMTGRLASAAGVTTGNNAMNVATASLGEVEVRNNSTGAAILAFLRQSSFGAYFGLDTDNFWKVGGWSMGAAAYKLFHEGQLNVRYRTIVFVIDGGGAAITTGVKGDLAIPFECTVDQVTLIADQSGSIVVDIWKSSSVASAWPPVAGNSMCGSAKPTISSTDKSVSTTLTGWSTVINAGGGLRFNVDSITTIQRCTVMLRVYPTTS